MFEALSAYASLAKFAGIGVIVLAVAGGFAYERHLVSAAEVQAAASEQARLKAVNALNVAVAQGNLLSTTIQQQNTAIADLQAAAVEKQAAVTQAQAQVQTVKANAARDIAAIQAQVVPAKCEDGAAWLADKLREGEAQ